MGQFLAPLNYSRAWYVLAELDCYSSYTAEGARALQELLRRSYPLIFQKMEQKTFANQALLLELQGANVTDPMVFVAHLDGGAGCFKDSAPLRALPPHSPSIPKSVGSQEPAAGKFAALAHAHAVTLLETVETLLAGGYHPSGDLILALSMDGLSHGEGARDMASHLKSRKLSPCYVLDFGGYVTRSAFRAFLPKNTPLAFVGVSEKGLLAGSLNADHSTLRGRSAASAASFGEYPISDDPCPGNQSLPELLKGGARLARKTRGASLCGSSTLMLETLGRKAPFPQRLLVAHPRLTFPLLRLLWRKRAIMRQFFMWERTLTAISSEGTSGRTPHRASLSFHQTTLPSRTLPAWKHILRERIANENLRLETLIEWEPSPHSHIGGRAWEALETAIQILFDRVSVAPCLSPYVCDGRFYAGLRNNVYRFSPFLLTTDEAARGQCSLTDDALQTAVQFFRQMLSV